MEPLLKAPNFIHPHKSFIVNADHVDRLTSQAFLMKGGAQVPITKSRYSQARARYLQYFDLTPGLQGRDIENRKQKPPGIRPGGFFCVNRAGSAS